MSKIGVYRVENALGKGPYMGCNYRETIGSVHSDADHPGPTEDGLLNRIPADYFFGFESLSQMQKWFSPAELTHLNKRGFRPKRFWVERDTVKHGSKQVLFYKN